MTTKNVKAGAEAKKLGLKKETLKDLNTRGAGAIKGGAKKPACKSSRCFAEL